MSGERVCVCCGFESATVNFFKRANSESPGKYLGYGNDAWICRNYDKCVERGMDQP